MKGAQSTFGFFPPLGAASPWGCLKVPELLGWDLWLLSQYFHLGLAESFSLGFSRQLEPVFTALSTTVLLVGNGSRSHSESEEGEDAATAAAAASCFGPFSSRRQGEGSLPDSASLVSLWKTRDLGGRGHQASTQGRRQQQMHLTYADKQHIPSQWWWKCGQQGEQRKQCLARLCTA